MSRVRLLLAIAAAIAGLAASAAADDVARERGGGDAAGATAEAVAPALAASLDAISHTADAPQREHARTARTARDWYALGGPTMHALAACSVLALAIALERLVATRRGRVAPRALAQALADDLREGRLDRARERCSDGRSSLARIATAALSPENAALRTETAGASESYALHRNLSLLAALGNVATMLGLFGTVLGMISAFDRIALAGASDARIVATGIFEALVTTAVGLAIGIGAVTAHATLARRAAHQVAELERFAGELLAGSGGLRAHASDSVTEVVGTTLPAHAAVRMAR